MNADVNRVTIVDYGMGNLFSVCRAVEQCGGEPRISADPAEVAQAERLILPGVGAFPDAMENLRAGGLDQAIRAFAARERPFLGICLGMQLMLETSEEYGDHPGLGLIPGRVAAIPASGDDGRPHPIPHIGWEELHPLPGGDWAGSLLEGLEPGVTCYFVHSYTAHPSDEGHRLADSRYHGRRIAAVIRRGPLHGCQFHPEKSGAAGLSIVRRFLAGG